MTPRNLEEATLPTLLRQGDDDKLAPSEIQFVPLGLGARSNAEICWLCRSEEGLGTSAALIRYRAGGHAPLHRHPSYELIYVLEGQMTTSQGTVRKNDLVLLPPGSQHQSRADGPCLALIVWNRPVELVKPERGP